MDLMIDYSVSDFEQAIRQLLPKGKYWQDPDNVELKQLIAGIAQEFKHVHDDFQITLQPQQDKILFGWKLSDYQALLLEYVEVGRVYDDKSTPNVIYVELERRNNFADAFTAFEAERLPHTQINWQTKSVTDLVINYVTASKMTRHRVYPLISPKADLFINYVSVSKITHHRIYKL